MTFILNVVVAASRLRLVKWYITEHKNLQYLWVFSREETFYYFPIMPNMLNSIMATLPTWKLSYKRVLKVFLSQILLQIVAWPRVLVVPDEITGKWRVAV